MQLPVDLVSEKNKPLTTQEQEYGPCECLPDEFLESFLVLFFLARRLDRHQVKFAGLLYKEDALRILYTTAFMLVSPRN